MPQKQHRDRHGRVGRGEENLRWTVVMKEQSSKKPSRKKKRKWDKSAEESKGRGRYGERNIPWWALRWHCYLSPWLQLQGEKTKQVTWPGVQALGAARDEDKQGTDWDQNLSPRFKVHKLTGAAEKWLWPSQASQRGGFPLTPEKPTEITRACPWRPLGQRKRNLTSLAAERPCGL